MTTHPTGDAPAASERVVEAVAEEICSELFGPYSSEEADRSNFSVSGQSRRAARAAIAAYQKAMREGE